MTDNLTIIIVLAIITFLTFDSFLISLARFSCSLMSPYGLYKIERESRFERGSLQAFKCTVSLEAVCKTRVLVRKYLSS